MSRSRFLIALALMFAVSRLTECSPLSRFATAAEPVHGYLNTDSLIHYSIEAGGRAYIRRVACDLSKSQCRLSRFSTYDHLPETVEYPIRIKGIGRYFWSVWPGERVQAPGIPPSVRIHGATPDFVCMRIERENLGEITISLNEAPNSNRGVDKPTTSAVAKYSTDDPITAMFRSLYVEIVEFDDRPRQTTPYPVNHRSPKFEEWYQKVQPEFNRFASYDLLAETDGGCRLFLVMEGSENRRYILPPSKERRMYELQVIPTPERLVEWTWRLVDHYPSDFVDRFYVIDSNRRRWFATGEGKLHRLEGQADAKGIRQIKLRDDKLIQVLLEEPGDPGRCFAFTANGWFELNEPLEYHDFELGALDATAPLPTLIHCATEVRKHFPALVSPTPK